jgi:hypothetical protein
MSLDGEYTSICKKLENELECKYKRVNEKMESFDKIEIAFDKVRFLSFSNLNLFLFIPNNRN